MAFNGMERDKSTGRWSEVDMRGREVYLLTLISIFCEVDVEVELNGDVDDEEGVFVVIQGGRSR